MNDFKVILIVPEYDTNKYRSGENLGIKYITSYLKFKNINCNYIEGNFSDNNIIISRIVKEKYDLVGFSINHQPLMNSCLRIIEEIKKIYNPHICLGGFYPTLNPINTLNKYSNIDSIVIADGEIPFFELCLCLKTNKDLNLVNNIVYRTKTGKVNTTSKSKLIENLDELPFPIRDTNSLFLGDKHFTIASSRGCPFSCSFCSVRSFYETVICKMWRYRSPENIILELKEIQQNYGLDSISFIDPNFLGSSNLGYKRAISIAKLIHENFPNVLWAIDARCDDIKYDYFLLLKKYGLAHVFLGVESFYKDTISNVFNKKMSEFVAINAIRTLQQLEVDIEIGFIMFHPYTTISELVHNVNIIKELKIGNSQIFINKLIVYSNTAIFDRLYKENNLEETKDGGYLYNFPDKKIDSIYRVISNSFKNIRKYEIENDKLIFKAQNQRNQDLLIFAKKKKEDISNFLCDAFKEVIKLCNTVSCNENTVGFLSNDLNEKINSFLQHKNSSNYDS